MTITETETIRDATAADADFLAWVMLTAARSHLELGIWDHLVGWDEPRVLDFLAELCVTGPEHLFHYSRFLVSEVNGVPAAALSGYRPELHGFEVYLPIFLEIVSKRGMTEEEIAAGWARGDAISSALSQPPANAWVVESVATLPEYRRRGLVDRLLDEILRRGRAEGCAVGAISVFIGNEPARAAYIKKGFEFDHETRTDAWEAIMGCPGIDHLLLHW